jgi:hypothetical protein
MLCSISIWASSAEVIVSGQGRVIATGIGLAHTKNTTLGAVNYWNDSDLSVMNRFLLVMNYIYCKCRTLLIGKCEYAEGRKS